MMNQTMHEIRFKRIATDSELQPIAYEKNVFDFIPLFFLSDVQWKTLVRVNQFKLLPRCVVVTLGAVSERAH